MMGAVTEYAVGLGLDAAKNHISGKLEEKKLHDALTSYIEHQRKYNEMSAIAEEIDFQGLVEYIRNNFLEVVSTRIFSPSRKERGKARQEIIDAAVSCLKADSPESRRRVGKAIAICLDIIRKFYKKQLSLKDYLIASDIVDAVSEELETSTNTIVAAVDATEKKLLAKLDEGGSLFSLDKAAKLAESGNIDTVGNGIKKVLDHISISHPYYPDFGYDYRGGKVVSKPLTTRAEKLYPSRITLTGAVRFGEKYYNDANGDPLDYAYRHQIPAIMEVTKAVKLLGSKLDPRQDEVAGLIGQTVVAEPPQFPPAFPCSIKVGEQTFFDYVLLRTQEIKDDGTYIVGNKEQGGALYFEVKFKLFEQSKPDFRFTMTQGSNREHLKYLRFMSALSKEKDLHIFGLSVGEDFIAGYINDLDLETGFSSIDEEIDFLERICAIEDYFNVTLTPDGEIDQNEYDTVVGISDLVRSDEVKGTWSEVTLTGKIDHNFREKLISMGEETYGFSFIGVTHVQLFGAEFDFRFMRSYKCAQIVDYEKLRRKVEVLDDGDEIKITFRSGDDKEIVDTLKIPEHYRRET